MDKASNHSQVIRELREKLYSRLRNDELRSLGHRIGSKLQREMVTNNRAQLRVRTGNLINSLQYKLTDRKDGIDIEAGSYNVKYAAIHEYGGVIRARRAQYLKFFIPGVGWRMAKQVTIPARPYIRPAFADSREYIMNLIRKHIEGQ